VPLQGPKHRRRFNDGQYSGMHSPQPLRLMCRSAHPDRRSTRACSTSMTNTATDASTAASFCCGRRRDSWWPRHGPGAAAALCAGPVGLLHRRAHQGPLRDLSVAGGTSGTMRGISGAASGPGRSPPSSSSTRTAASIPTSRTWPAGPRPRGFCRWRPTDCFPSADIPQYDDGRTLQASLDQASCAPTCSTARAF